MSPPEKVTALRPLSKLDAMKVIRVIFDNCAGQVCVNCGSHVRVVADYRKC